MEAAVGAAEFYDSGEHSKLFDQQRISGGAGSDVNDERAVFQELLGFGRVLISCKHRPANRNGVVLGRINELTRQGLRSAILVLLIRLGLWMASLRRGVRGW